jgi:LEA14-like dessication related protein
MTVQKPDAALLFKGIQADDPAYITLFFVLEAGDQPGRRGRIESWQVEIDGQKAASAFTLEYPQGDFLLSNQLPLRLNMDIAALAARGLAPRDEYKLNLITVLVYSANSTQGEKLEVSCLAAFSGVQTPDFSITSIAIIKAELINTRFKVSLKMDNSNPFPVELSAFVYKLYGNGRLWAEGTEKNIFKVNGKSSLTGELFLVMNFINMDRNLLDQVIRLEHVNYRFTGSAQVSTGVEYLPRFSTDFDLSGYSEVLEK